MAKRLSVVYAAANIRGNVDQLLEALKSLPHDPEQSALVLVGNLSANGQAESFRKVFSGLGESGWRVFWVPGPEDAPVSNYLREAYNVEIVFPLLRGIHGSFAFAPGYVLFAGIGGEIVDAPDTPREEIRRLRYPGWEAELRLKPLQELDAYPNVFVFSTPAYHKGQKEGRSQTLTELINTYRPRLAIYPSETSQTDTEFFGRTFAVEVGNFEAVGVVGINFRTLELI